MTQRFPLELSSPADLHLDGTTLSRLDELINRHIAEGRYPGAQIAIARYGKLALVKTYGDARLDPERGAARVLAREHVLSSGRLIESVLETVAASRREPEWGA